jgi:glycerol-3-phosphate dehydrogenase (NAD(P)+)
MPELEDKSIPVVGVIGGGSWASALVKIITEGDVRVNWWMRSESQRDHIKQHRHNPNYLSDIAFDLSKVFPETSIQQVVEQSDILILALPAAFIEETLAALSSEQLAKKFIFSAVKGMIPSCDRTLCEFLSLHVGLNANQLGVIAGPCHSEEVALERRSYLTISANDGAVAQKMAELLRCRYIHTHTIDSDVHGIELATVMKNIFALASGIARGLNYGDNFQAVLIANAMQEMQRLLNDLLPRPNRDTNESAFLGDLLVTAYSPFSRNRIFGQMIGKGYTVKAARMEMNMIAEGYFAVKSVMNKVQGRNLELPICTAVYSVLYENNPAAKAFRKLEEQLH